MERLHLKFNRAIDLSCARGWDEALRRCAIWRLRQETAKTDQLDTYALALFGVPGRKPNARNEQPGWRGIRWRRGAVRAILFLVSWSAARGQRSLRAFYRRLLAVGKPKQVTRITVARKILLAFNEISPSR